MILGTKQTAPEIEARIRELKAKDPELTNRQIAARFGISPSTVFLILKVRS